MSNEKLESLLDELDAEGYKKGIPWNGYEVYIPIYSGDPKIGLPYVILENGAKMRICTPEESLQYLDHQMSSK